MVVALKAYSRYPVTKDWRERVRAALDAQGRGAYARLAEFLEGKLHRKISTGHLSEVLSGEYETSDYIDPIHEFLGWTDAVSPTAALDAGELMHAVGRLTPEQRGMVDDALATLEGEFGEDAKTALVALLRALRATRQHH